MKILYALIILFFSGVALVSTAQTPHWQWAKNAAGNCDEADMCTDVNGNVYITGTISGDTVVFGNDSLINSKGQNIFIAKYDSSGNISWVRNIPTFGYGTGICTDTYGNIFTTGTFQNDTVILGLDTLTNYEQFNLFIAKYNSSGDEIWASSPDVIGFANAIKTDARGNIYLTGFFEAYSATFGNQVLTSDSINNIFIVKYDSSGNVAWAKNIPAAKGDLSYAICTNSQDDVYLTGTFSDSVLLVGNFNLINTGIQNMFIVKYDSAGNLVWAENAMGNSSFNTADAIAADANGNVLVTGYFQSPGITFGNYNLSTAHQEVFIVKYDSSGDAVWAKKGIGETIDQGGAVCTDAANNAYLSGYFFGSNIIFENDTINNIEGGDSAYNIFIVKYDAAGNLVWVQSIGGVMNPIQDFINRISAVSEDDIYVAGDVFCPNIIFGNYVLNNFITPGLDFFVARLDDNVTSNVTDVGKSSVFITVYPNPTSSIIYFKGVQTGQTLQVYNLLGEEISSSVIDEDNYSINLSGKAKGMYFYRVEDSSSLVQQGKIIVE